MIKLYKKNWIKIKTPNLTQQCSNKSNQNLMFLMSKNWKPIKVENPENFKQQKLKLLLPTKIENPEKFKNKKPETATSTPTIHNHYPKSSPICPKVFRAKQHPIART